MTGKQLSLSAAQLTVSLLCTGMSEKSGDTHTHANTDTHTPVAEVGGL